jgi:hypothetical protein
VEALWKGTRSRFLLVIFFRILFIDFPPGFGFTGGGALEGYEALLALDERIEKVRGTS